MTDTNANVPKVRAVPPANKSAVMPTEGSARRDAIGALVDDVTSANIAKISTLRKAADDLDATVLQHAAKLKAELEMFVRNAETAGSVATTVTDHVEKMRSEHAKLVEGK